jgi:uncharacterized membrane protein
LSVLRLAWLSAVASLALLIALCVSWELWLAPLRPGGSWAVLKVLPLLAPLRGVLNAKVYTYQWAPMLVLPYFIEGVARAYADRGAAAVLASLEIALTLTFLGAAVLFLRQSRRAASQVPIKPED